MNNLCILHSPFRLENSASRATGHESAVSSPSRTWHYNNAAEALSRCNQVLESRRLVAGTPRSLGIGEELDTPAEMCVINDKPFVQRRVVEMGVT